MGAINLFNVFFLLGVILKLLLLPEPNDVSVEHDSNIPYYALCVLFASINSCLHSFLLLYFEYFLVRHTYLWFMIRFGFTVLMDCAQVLCLSLYLTYYYDDLQFVNIRFILELMLGLVTSGACITIGIILV